MFGLKRAWRDPYWIAYDDTERSVFISTHLGAEVAHARQYRHWQTITSRVADVIRVAEHKAYLAEVERLAAEDPAPGTPDGDRLELLAKLVEDYEKKRFRFNRPDPVSAIKFRMEEKGLKQKDLAEIMGGKNRVSEVLSGERQLTLPMVRALSERLGIPADLLIRDV